MGEIKAGLCQMPVTDNKLKNHRAAADMIARAAGEGAQLVVLPEMWNCPYDNAWFPRFAEPEDGETCGFLSEQAKAHKITLVGGSIPEGAEGRVYNTSYSYGPDGALLAKHRKVHLFDIDVPGGVRFMESETLSPGQEVTVFDTPFARIGVAVCFDIRFTQFFALMGEQDVDLIVVPGAFNMTTGPAHWELSFRMRAVDHQCFTLGCAPARDESGSYVSYGNSLVCDPWGKVCARLSGEEGVLIASLDLDEIARIRGAIPIKAAARKDLYTLTGPNSDCCSRGNPV